jgi:hypothetical protein
MRKIVIEDLYEVAEAMYSLVTETNVKDAEFVGFYEDAQTIVKYLLLFDDTLAYSIELVPEEWSNYEKEYYVSIDSDLNVICTKAYNCNTEHYLEETTDVLFIADDCSSVILSKVDCDEDDKIEVSYEEDECECDGNCGCCGAKDTDNHEEITRVARDDEGNLRGFEKSWSTHEDGLHYHSTYSFYSNNQNMLKNMLENFSIKY